MHLLVSVSDSLAEIKQLLDDPSDVIDSNFDEVLRRPKSIFKGVVFLSLYIEFTGTSRIGFWGLHITLSSLGVKGNRATGAPSPMSPYHLTALGGG